MKLKQVLQENVIDLKSAIHKRMDKEFDANTNNTDAALDMMDDAIENVIDVLERKIKDRDKAEQIIINHLSEVVMYHDMKDK